MLFIPLDQLKGGMKLANDVLIFERSNVRLLTKGMTLTDHMIRRMYRFGVDGIYVKDEITGDIIPSAPAVNNKVKTRTLQDLEWVFSRSTDDTEKARKSNTKYIKHIDKTVLSLMDMVKNSKASQVNIMDLKAYDEYTYHHSLSVTVLSLAIGMELGLPEEEMHKLGFASIMHDIGKMHVPIEIINKPGKLSMPEYDVMKRHSWYGWKYLTDNGIRDPEILGAVLAHHEKVDGSGYPKGLKGSDVPFFGRIISVADVYDALTSHRPYRDPELPSAVAEYIMGNCGSSFDMDVVRAFMDKVEFFPIGSFVEFSDGKKGVIINNQMPLHPTVRLVEPPFTTLDLFNDKHTYNTTITKLYEGAPLEAIAAV